MHAAATIQPGSNPRGHLGPKSVPAGVWGGIGRLPDAKMRERMAQHVASL